MHPMMIMAVAREIDRERQRARHKVQLRSLAVANHAEDFVALCAAREFAGRLRASISLRPHLS